MNERSDTELGAESTSRSGRDERTGVTQAGTRVAVLGTGRMGAAISRRLNAGGFQVSVWDQPMPPAKRRS